MTTKHQNVDIIGRAHEETWAELQEKSIAGVRFALVNNPKAIDEFAIVPFNAPEHSLPPQTPGEHYAQGSFDGGSVILRWSPEGEFKGAYIVLEEVRHQRFLNSMRNWDYAGVLSSEEFGKNLRSASKDLLAMQVAAIIASGGKQTRIYERKAGRRVGPMGVALSNRDNFMITDISWPWGPYLEEEAYEKGATTLVFLDTARVGKIVGKDYRNYGQFGPTGTVARDNGFNEAIVIGPYLVDENGQKEYLSPEINLVERIEDVVLADGPGEDFVFVSPEGKIIINPEDTNILRGTTRGYVIEHVSKTLGMEVEERAVTVRDIENEKLVPVFVGNAVKGCPVGSLSFYDGEKVLDKKIDITMNEHARKLIDRFNAELDGLEEPSDPSLLTEIDLERGFALLKVFNKKFPGKLTTQILDYIDSPSL